MRQGKQAQIYTVGLLANGEETDLQKLTGYNRVDLRFGMDGKGEIYILSKGNGAIYKIVGFKKKTAQEHRTTLKFHE